MKAIKLAVVIGAVVSMVVTQCFSEDPTLFKATISATTYKVHGTSIVITKATQDNFISSCTSNVGARLVLDTTHIGTVVTNVLVTMDACGDVLCTNVILVAQSCADVYSGTVYRGFCNWAFTVNGEATAGNMVIKYTGTPGNLIWKGRGVFTDSNGNPGVLTIAVGGQFKMPASGCPVVP
jgi:hypothetical protein